MSDASLTGEGLVARFAPIKGITPKGALGERVWLPATLNTFTVDEQATHNEYDTLSGGHFSQPAMGGPDARQFRTLSVDAITVEFDAPFLVATGQDAFTVRDRLYSILRYRKPVHLLVTFNPSRHQPYAELDAYVTFREISRDVRPGELESRYFTIQISEWRDPSVSRRSSSPQGRGRKRGVELPTTHKLKATDTLESLSHEYYGTYSLWRHVRDANGIPKRFGQKTPLVQLPGRWRVGYKVKIPKVAIAHAAV